MTSFFWNVRGLNKILKHSVVEEYVRKKEMLFGCILETRVKESKAGRILKKVFRDWSYITNYEFSQGGCWGKIFHEEITPASGFLPPGSGFLFPGSEFLPPGLGPCLQPPAFRPSYLSCFRINGNLPLIR